MAPRRRTAATAAVAAAGAAPTLLSLPDDVLVRCLAELELAERFKAAALVCKRLRALCMSPQLLQTVMFSAQQPEAAVPRLRALLRFLQAHGRQHVSELYLLEIPLDSLPAEQWQEAVALLPACLAACGGPPSHLTRLELQVAQLPSLAWLPGLTALRHLELVCKQQLLRIPCGMQQLSCLTMLALAGAAVELEEGTQLPAGLLLELNLHDGQNQQLPPQVSLLSRLTSMLINDSTYTADGLAVLQAIASLRCLRLVNSSMPACLPALTGLQQLLIVCYPASVSEELAAALPQLRSLTALIVRAVGQRIPAALSSLSSLQRLSLSSFDDADETEESRLPVGPWLASIRWLGLPWPVLQRSAAALACATQLEYLCALSMPETAASSDAESSARWRRFWRFLASHPPLRCFAVETGHYGDAAEPQALGRPWVELLRALLLLRGMRPDLRIRYLASDFEGEASESEAIPNNDPIPF